MPCYNIIVLQKRERRNEIRFCPLQLQLLQFYNYNLGIDNDPAWLIISPQVLPDSVHTKGGCVGCCLFQPKCLDFALICQTVSPGWHGPSSATCYSTGWLSFQQLVSTQLGTPSCFLSAAILVGNMAGGFLNQLFVKYSHFGGQPKLVTVL